MTPKARRGRRPNGSQRGTLVGEARADEVYAILRELKGPQNRIVAHGEIWPRIRVDAVHDDEENHRKCATYQALRLLCKRGWIEEAEGGGYRDLDPLLYPFYGIRSLLADTLDTRIAQIIGPVPQGERERKIDAFLAETSSSRLAHLIGEWLREMDRVFEERSSKIGIPIGTSSGVLTPVRRAAAVAKAVADGYLMIEQDKVESRMGRRSALFSTHARISDPKGYSELLRTEEREGRMLAPGHPKFKKMMEIWASDANQKTLKSRNLDVAKALLPERRRVAEELSRLWEAEADVGLDENGSYPA